MSAEGNVLELHGGWDTLLGAWQHLDVPDGWRAEVIREGILISPPMGNRDHLVASDVHRAFSRIVPDEWGLYRVLGVSIPLRGMLFVPDLVVAPRAELRVGPDNEPLPAERALLVVEITSKGNAEDDRKTKRWGYAHAGVPLYLLIDRFEEDGPSVTLFADPVNGHYQHLTRIPFGEKITVPDPFAFDLDTSEF